MSMSIGLGPWPQPVRDTAELCLQTLGQIEQIERLEGALDQQAGVQEARLIEDLANRIGVVEARAAEHLDARP